MKEIADFIEPFLQLWDNRFNKLETIMKKYGLKKANNMEQKAKVNADDGKQELVITREFDLPLELLFKAYVEPDLVETSKLSRHVIYESVAQKDQVLKLPFT